MTASMPDPTLDILRDIALIEARRHPAVCPACGGAGCVPFAPTVFSRDPRNFDGCEACDGTGRQS